MTTITRPNSNLEVLYEKLQQDVDTILVDFEHYMDESKELNEHFDVDMVLKVKAYPQKHSVKSVPKTNHYNHKHQTHQMYQRVDAKLNPINPHYYDDIMSSRQGSIFKRIGIASQIILGLA